MKRFLSDTLQYICLKIIQEQISKSKLQKYTEIKHTFDSMYFLKECICVDLHTVCLCVFHTLYVLKN